VYFIHFFDKVWEVEKDNERWAVKVMLEDETSMEMKFTEHIRLKRPFLVCYYETFKFISSFVNLLKGKKQLTRAKELVLSLPFINFFDLLLIGFFFLIFSV
jgi:hypothetical protein